MIRGESRTQMAEFLTDKMEDDVHVISLNGRFDAHEAPTVHKWLDKHNTEGIKILVELSEVTFMDSTALAALVTGMKHSRSKNGDLYLCGLQQSVKIIFELTRLDKAFSIFENEHDALMAFQAV